MMKKVLIAARKGIAICIALFACGGFACMAATGEITFTDVTKDAGVGDNRAWGIGTAFGDYDNDGNLDIYVSNWSGMSVLYRNNGDGTFTDVTEIAGMLGEAHWFACVFGDYDNDDDLDIYSSRDGPNVLYRNNGDGTLSNIAKGAGVDNETWGYDAIFGDYDNDGDIDIYVVSGRWADRKSQANILYRNNGDGTFTDVAKDAGVRDTRAGTCATFGDYDNDGDIDIYLTNNGQLNILYRNNGDGTFKDVAFAAGVAGPRRAWWTGAAFGDYDNDGHLDIYVSTVDGPNLLYHNNGDGTFEDVAPKAGVGDAAWGRGITFCDFDNDGYLDIYLANVDSSNKLYRNNGDGTFTDIAKEAGVGYLAGGFGCTVGDYDNDGDLDIYAVGIGANVLYQNDGNDNNWLHVKTVGTISNRNGIGARVKVTTGTLSMIREVSGGSGFCSQDSLPVEFGLGKNEKADKVEVRWPSGAVDGLTNIPANQVLVVKEAMMAVEPHDKQLITWGRVRSSKLFQNYPNPFNPDTWIPYQLGEPADVTIRMYAQSGQLVRTLRLGHKEAGTYLEKCQAGYWDGRNDAGEPVASGVYFYRLEAGDFCQTRKMTVLK